MKPIRLLIVLLTIIFYPIAIAYAEVCVSPKTFFSKVNSSDWNLPENQDRISDTVWITRANQQGIFNIASETSFVGTASPANTEWSFGSASDFTNLTFTNWAAWHGSNPPSMVGQDAVIHLIDTDTYLDIKFLDWQQGSPGDGSGGGGGFLYERSVCSPVVIGITANNTDGPLTISQSDTLSLAVSLNPDAQAGADADWWLLVTTPSGIFHYDLASASWLPGLLPSREHYLIYPHLRY